MGNKEEIDKLMRNEHNKSIERISNHLVEFFINAKKEGIKFDADFAWKIIEFIESQKEKK